MKIDENGRAKNGCLYLLILALAFWGAIITICLI